MYSVGVITPDVYFTKNQYALRFSNTIQSLCVSMDHITSKTKNQGNMSCGLLGYNTPADHKMEILRALVKFVNQILKTFVCRFAHKNKSECPVIIWTRQNLFKAAFPLKLCTRMLFCNKKWVTQGRRHAFWEPFGTGRPFSVHKRMSCSLFVLAHVSPCQASSSFFLSFLLSSTHPFRPSKFSSALFYTGFFVGSSFVENRRE